MTSQARRLSTASASKQSASKPSISRKKEQTSTTSPTSEFSHNIFRKARLFQKLASPLGISNIKKIYATAEHFFTTIYIFFFSLLWRGVFWAFSRLCVTFVSLHFYCPAAFSSYFCFSKQTKHHKTAQNTPHNILKNEKTSLKNRLLKMFYFSFLWRFILNVFELKKF